MKFIADGNVNVFDNDKMIEANIISYSDSTQIMGLKSGAKVTSNNRKLFGENIQINFIDSLISFINVSGDATAHNIIKAKIQKDSDSYKDLVDIMKGNSIDVSFENDQIQKIVLNVYVIGKHSNQNTYFD